METNHRKKQKGKKKNTKHCINRRTSRITGMRVAQLLQSGASQAAILRAIEHGRKEMDLEQQLRVARQESSKSMRKDRLMLQADRL